MEVYVDDITMYGGAFEESLANLETVLRRCIEKNLVLNWEKCNFIVNQGIFLGHVIFSTELRSIRPKLSLFPSCHLPQVSRQ